MRKVLILGLIFTPFFATSQVIVRFTTPQTLPNLIPGYNEVGSINEQILSFTYTLPPAPPTPIDGDTTTEDNGPFKYGEVIPVNFSLANGNYTQTSEGKVWTLSIRVLGGAKNIGLTFDSVTLVANAELYVYNQSKTILMGAVKGEYIHQPGILTTGACVDSIIYIYVIERNSTSFQSSFKISRVIPGFIDVDASSEARLAINTSCMLHLPCFPDKMFFAGAVARISIAVPGVGAGSGTGTLINNEDNNARPYFLTAFHIIDLNDDNQISADEILALRTAVFRFQFWRTGCGSDFMNPSIEFTGAILRASRPTDGASDMALLELIDHPGLGDGVNYAGWNRSTSPPSNTLSFIIHHPDGKDMRLTKTSSVGYYIFGDDYWQAYYQGSSAVAKGSSGAALFNGNNQIVGQLRGGWSACGIGFSDRYGKLSKSWLGGGTNETRLSNWISPNQNLSSMDLFDPTTVSVQGSDAVGCTGTKQYSVSNNLFDVNYIWTVTNNLQILGPQNTPTLTVSRAINGTGPGTITVTLTSNSGFNRVLVRTKQVTVGLPNSVSFTQKTITCVNTKPYFFGAVAAIADATNYQWFAKDESNPNNPFVLKQSENSNTADFPLGNNHGNRYYTIRVVVTTSCGTVQTIDADGYMYAPACGNGFRIITSPNPTNSRMTVRILDETTLNSEKTSSKFYQIQIVNRIGVVLKQYKYSKGETQANLNLSNLASDIYLLRLWDGKEWRSVQIIKSN